MENRCDHCQSCNDCDSVCKKAPMIPNDELREEAFINALMKWSDDCSPARSTILFTLFNALSVTMVDFMEHKIDPESVGPRYRLFQGMHDKLSELTELTNRWLKENSSKVD